MMSRSRYLANQMMTFGFYCCLVSSGLLLTACTSIDTFRHPKDAIVADTVLATPEEIAKKYQIDTQWWKQYQNPELNQLVKTAITNNINIKKTAIALKQSIYQTEQTGINAVPNFSSSSSASRIHDFKTGRTNPPSYSIQLSMSYELDVWKKLATAQTATEWEAKASAADLESVKLTVINQVINSYFYLSYLKENYETNQKNLLRYQKLLDIASAKYEYGKTSVMPYLHAKQSYLELRFSLLNLRSSYRQAEQTLKNLLNKRADESLDLTFTSVSRIPLLGVDLSVPLSVLANRPDLKSALARLQAVHFRQESQKRAWYPNISLSTGISSSNEQLGKILSLPIGNAAISLNLPFLQWQTLELQDKQAQANFDNAKLSFEKALTTALNEVDNLYHRYQSAQQQLNLLEEKYKLTQRSSHFQKAEYELGKSELANYLSTLNSLDSVKNSLLNQRYELLRAEISVYQAMAGKLQQN